MEGYKAAGSLGGLQAAGEWGKKVLAKEKRGLFLSQDIIFLGGRELDKDFLMLLSFSSSGVTEGSGAQIILLVPRPEISRLTKITFLEEIEAAIRSVVKFQIFFF